MLEITPIASGESATRYYVSVEQPENYYLAERGEWGGKGAELLGLKGEVQKSDFHALSTNKVPGTDRNLTVRTKKNRRSGYDFCFDVPKSLSIYLAETGDQNVERIIIQSFKETIGRIEQATRTRVCHGPDITTGNIIYASFIHRVSRPIDGVPDPQYHIHCYVFNATFDRQENRWKAGQFGEIMYKAPQYEAEFHECVRTKLVNYGFRVRRTEHAFELSTISRELIEKFSRRHQEIMRSVGNATGRVRAWFSRNSRKPKSAITLDQTQQLDNWRSRMTNAERDQVHTARHQGLPSPRTLFSFGIHQRYWGPDKTVERIIQR